MNGIMLSSSALASAARPINRRKFLGGNWFSPNRDMAERWAAAIPSPSLLIHARPQAMDATARAISAIDHVNLVRRDAAGRLRVHVDATAAEDIATVLSAILGVPGVLAANLAPPQSRAVPS